MAKILGLDLGTNSIGWAVVENKEGKLELKEKGVRIFQRGYGDEYQDSSRAAERTSHRGARKLNYRRKGRKIELLRLLGKEFHPFEDDELTSWHKKRSYPVREKLIEWFKLNPYELRKRAVDGEKLSKKELGRIFYHLTQRRGFKSNKKDTLSLLSATEVSTNKKSLPKDIEYHKEYEEEYGDIPKSKILYQKHIKAERIRNTTEENKISRKTLELDFHAICRHQNLSEEFIKEVRKTIFEARPLKSQKGNVGKCVFETGKSRCPLSSIEFEEYRMYSFINNIKIKKVGEEKKNFKSLREQTYFGISIEENILPLFYRKSKGTFKFEDIHNMIDKTGIYEFNYKDTTTVSGCPVSAHLKDLFGEDWKSVKFYNGKNKKGENKYIDIRDIWHMFFDHFIQDKADGPLIDIAKNKFGLGDDKAERFINAPIKQGYANLSFKAIGKIMPFLIEGYRPDKAILLAKIPDILELSKGENIPDDILEDVNSIFDKYSYEKKKNDIVNDCIAIFRNESKNAHTKYCLDDRDKEIVLKQFLKKYGEKTWNGFEQEIRNKIIAEVEADFERQLQSGNIGGSFIKTKSIKQQVQDYLINELAIEEEKAKKIYHPSAIEFYPKVEPNKNGVRLLKSPLINSIKNPLFMRAMCELRKVINALLINNVIDDETQIVVELGRDVNDYNMRKAIERFQKERETENEFYKNLLVEFYKENKLDIQPGNDEKDKIKFWVEQLEDENEAEQFYNKLEIHTAQFTKREKRMKLPDYAIEKYRLWREQNGICIYTGNQIGMADLINGNKHDIEHTIPLSKSFDNSLSNKTIAESYYNRSIKGNKLPSELGNDYDRILTFIKRWEKKVEILEDRIEDLKRKGKNIHDKATKNHNIQERHYLKMHLDYWQKKVNNFKLTEVTDDFKNRQLTDIGIINKYALLYLKSAFNNVFNISSLFVDEFRKITGYEKSRDNHVHHTIDAVYCACLVGFARRKPETLKKLERYYYLQELLKKALHFNKEEKSEGTKKLKEQIVEAREQLIPWENFLIDMQNLRESILVSHRIKDNLKKQTKKKIRVRGKIVHRADQIEKDTNGSIKVLEWKYKTDINGKNVPVKGKRNDVTPDFILHIFKVDNKQNIKVLNSFDEYRETEGTINLKGYEFVKDKDGKVVFEKEARYTWHNDKANNITTGIRDKLHKDFFFGKIKRPMLDSKNQIKKNENDDIVYEDWYVKRMPIENLNESGIKNIVDKGIQDRILKYGLKNVKSKGQIVLPVEDGKKEMIIKTIRCRQIKAKGYLTAIPLKENSHKSKKHKKRIEKFGKDYKEKTYVDNDGNYLLGIYSDDKIVKYRFLNNLDVGRLLNSHENDVTLPINDYFEHRSKKCYLELKQMLKQDLFILLLQKNENIDDINWKDYSELQKRLYEIKSFGESGKYAVIFCLFHQCAISQSDLKVKDGKFELNEPIVLYRKFIHTNFNAVIEGVDFKITALGEIIKI
ncbi:MAG: hypothetical protein JXB24_03805 [Bacteroidales bacterium]|nr:hypothetical protein [Bacteroidales bacterium]